MKILLHSWEAGFALPILEAGRLRLAEVMPFVLRASKRRSHSLDPGLPSSKGFFHVTHEERTGYRARICQTKNLSTRNDKDQCGYDASGWDDARAQSWEGEGVSFPGDHAEAYKMLLFPAQCGKEDPLFSPVSAEHPALTR